MNKDNYHEQGNIIIMLLLLPLGHISNITYARAGDFSATPSASSAAARGQRRWRRRRRRGQSYFRKYPRFPCSVPYLFLGMARVSAFLPSMKSVPRFVRSGRFGPHGCMGVGVGSSLYRLSCF